MPIESRQIKFTSEEVTRAVTKLLVHHGMVPAGHKIAGLDINEAGGKISAIVIVAVPEATESRRLPLNTDVLTAALIRMCREVLIPMPRGARKVLVRHESGLELHSSFDTAEATLEMPAQPKAAAATAPAAVAVTDKSAQAVAPENDDESSEDEPSAVPDWWATMSKAIQQASEEATAANKMTPDWWAAISKEKRKKK